jgi:calmodulin
LNPRFERIAKDPKYEDLPVVFADLSLTDNKEFVKSLGVLALPSIIMYAATELVENFPCGPSKVPILKSKLAQLVQDRVDPITKLLRDRVVGSDEDSPSVVMDLSVDGKDVSQEMIQSMRTTIPYFADLTKDEFYGLMNKAKLLSFEPNSIIVRQGKPGRTFYVIQSGEVEVSCRTAFEDPLTTPAFYLGTVINRLTKNDYFGERAMITGEPLSASIVSTEATQCFAFDMDDIPPSSILSGKGLASEDRMEQVNNKYGVDVTGLDMIEMNQQLEASKLGSQTRGSFNKPNLIRGVDTDEDIVESEIPINEIPANKDDDTIISLLQKFRMIRHATRCFDYIMTTTPKWGDDGSQRRRNMLVNRLTAAQKEEFQEVFHVIDQSGDGEISLMELKRVMDSVGEQKTDAEIQAMIANSHAGVMDGKEVITLQDFMGIAAEAEFYHLFRDTFASLDKHDSGFVKASDLDRVLCGMRDLISDDRKSIIDVEDKDMMIDYEQFSKMLLGSSLS